MTQLTGRSVFIELQPEEDITPVVLPALLPATSWSPFYSAPADCTCAVFPHIAQCAITVREGGARLRISQGIHVTDQRPDPNVAGGFVIQFLQEQDLEHRGLNGGTAFVCPEGKVHGILRFRSLSEARNSFFSRCLKDEEPTRKCPECLGSQVDVREHLRLEHAWAWAKFYANNDDLEVSFCGECGRNLDWSHAEDCASGAADRILSGDYSDLFDN